MVSVIETKYISKQQERQIVDSIKGRHGLENGEIEWIANQMVVLFRSQAEKVARNPQIAQSMLNEWFGRNDGMIKQRFGSGILKRNLDEKYLTAIRDVWQQLCSTLQSGGILSISNTPVPVASAESGNKRRLDKPLIQFGRELESVESLQLPHRDLSFLSQILEKQSSGGAACVPTVHAYLMMIKRNITEFSSQQNLLTSILRQWREKYNGDWIQPQELHDEFDEHEMRLSAIKKGPKFCDMLQLNRLLHFLTARRGTEFTSTFGDRRIVSRENFTAAIFTTRFRLLATVEHVSKNNPQWAREGRGVPRIGDRFTTAGDHALLAVDYQRISQNEYKIFVIDPQNGSILSILLSDMIRVAQASPDYNTGARDLMYGVGTGVL